MIKNENISEVAKYICAQELEVETDDQGTITFNPLVKIRQHGFKKVALAIEKYLERGNIKAKWSE